MCSSDLKLQFFCPDLFANMDIFYGDYYGTRCNSGKRSGDVFNDYIDILHGVACDESSIKWRLSYLATFAEYELWEHQMEEGFSRCDTYEYAYDNICLVLAL